MSGINWKVEKLKGLMSRPFFVFIRTSSGDYSGALYLVRNGEPEYIGYGEIKDLLKDIPDDVEWKPEENLVYIDNSEFGTKEDDEWLEALKIVFPDEFDP